MASWDGKRRERLAAEALDIAKDDGRPELVASALLARRLALWQLDRLDERTDAVLVAVDEARRAGNVHLELTATLFAMSDLLEQGCVDDHLRLLGEFRARATGLHQPLYVTYVLFIEAGHRLAAGDDIEAERIADEALLLGRKSHGANAEIVHAGIRFLLAQHRGRVASHVGRQRADGGAPPSPADVEDRDPRGAARRGAGGGSPRPLRGIRR